MMMMQASMAQMGQMMNQMAQVGNLSSSSARSDGQERNAPAAGGRPPRPQPPPAKIPHGTKLGGHAVSAVPPRQSVGPIPDKPSSKALCKYAVACSNSRCIYSHPSPVADEKTGMVLSEDACEAGKECKDPECIQSHVSPAAVHGEKAGPGRMLCKFQNCTNPSCAFRHEDAEGNPIPPPALTNPKAFNVPGSNVVAEAPASTFVTAPSSVTAGSDDGDVEVVMSSKSLMDGALEDKPSQRPCRYGERCTRADCFFSHPAGRAPPASSKGAQPPSAIARGGMSASKKFGAPLNPTANAFEPATA